MPDNEAFSAVTVAQMRRKQGAKWSLYGEEVLPSWVADMDFPLAPPIHAALSEQCAAQDFGYPMPLSKRPLVEIFSAWAQRRYNWQVDPGRIEGMVDIVQGIYLALQLYSEPGDSVLTLTPTYPPLWRSIEGMGRRLLDCSMRSGESGYEIDFDQLRDQLDARTKLFLLCNPHNPTGRVFTRTELEGLAELVLEHDLIVVADEIHADLVYAPHQHIPFASLGKEIEARTITMTSATKSFNIGGLRFAIAVFGSQALQDRFNSWPKGALGGVNSLGVLATEVAWSDCDDWLEELLAYLQGNRDFVLQQVQSRMPQVEIFKPEATYLAWLGCQALRLNNEPFEHFLDNAKVGFGNGVDFGSGGEGFVRLNFATSRTILAETIDRAVASLPSPD